MPLLIDPNQQRTSLQFAEQNPVQGFDPGFVERFKADFAAMQGFSNSNADYRNMSQVATDFRVQFYKASGQNLPDWIDSGLYNTKDEAEKQFNTWKAKNPQSDLVFPSNEQFQKNSDDLAAKVRNKSTMLSSRSSGFGSAVGGFLGTAAGALTDPINVLTLPLGGSASGFLRTALVEGGINAASEAAIQGLSFDRKQRIDPSYTAMDSLKEVAAAGVGGAVFAVGIKGAAAAWERAATGSWPRTVQDASNVVMREASVPAARLDRSAQGAAVYRGAIEKASDDLFRGKPVEIPQDAFLQANARPGRVYDADGRSVGVTYEVVEADSLVTSHRNDMSVNPDFPQELQPRDRTRAISHDQIQSISGNLQPERLGPSSDAATGAPIIGPDGLVESGNGRALALRRAYMENGASAESYRNYLRSQNYDIEGFANPVLVARRITDLDPESRIGFVTAANRSTAMRLGAAEQSISDARLIDDSVLSKLKGSDAEALGNRDFVRGFMQKLPRTEQGELVDKAGVLSQAGERRVMAALMGRAYGEPALLGRALEDADSNIKSLAGALGDSAGSWAIMRDAVARGDIPAGMDITDDLLEAVRLVMKARDEGRAVKDMVNQAEMFGGPNEVAKIVARAMFGDGNLTRAVSRKRLSTFLNDYADEALKNDAADRLFGNPLESADVLRTSLAKANREDLIQLANERLTPDAVDKIASAPETADAIVMEGERIRAEHRDVTIDLGDGLGERSLNDIFEEADSEIAAAADIEACALGRSATAGE